MKRTCAWCGITLQPDTHQERRYSPITHGICPSCAEQVLGHERSSFSEFLDTLGGPVIVVDGDGIVLNANKQAQNLLQKDLDAVRGKRGGDIIECQYSRSSGGCGRNGGSLFSWEGPHPRIWWG